ncbi:hypothetical protein [Bacillus thuringiensis]|uniref:hypothetical protein n=1 Tax=Bacillus thuringiensis TaxID=1428 RepID=UPI000BFC5AB7|nr:hypothetical protein [Bacillus thuringiensis]PGY46860.1 hypothetical protein COE09_22995 [Bacillus thuringiensis]
MYGQVAQVTYKGKTYPLFIACTYRDTPEELSKMGLFRLLTLEKEHPELTIEEIVDLVNNTRL